MDKSRDELWEDINDLEEECLGYQAEVEELKDKIEELETENDALREKNNRLREEKTATENELKAEKITKTIFEADIQRLRALNEDYQNRPGTFQDQSGKYEDALDRTGLASEINSLEHDKRELKRKINQLEKEKQAWHIERAGLMLKSANSFESHSDCRKEMMKYCGERDTALARVQALEREQYGIMEESLEANRLLEHYKKELEELKALRSKEASVDQDMALAGEVEIDQQMAHTEELQLDQEMSQTEEPEFDIDISFGEVEWDHDIPIGGEVKTDPYAQLAEQHNIVKMQCAELEQQCARKEQERIELVTSHEKLQKDYDLVNQDRNNGLQMFEELNNKYNELKERNEALLEKFNQQGRAYMNLRGNMDRLGQALENEKADNSKYVDADIKYTANLEQVKTKLREASEARENLQAQLAAYQLGYENLVEGYNADVAKKSAENSAAKAELERVQLRLQEFERQGVDVEKLRLQLREAEQERVERENLEQKLREAEQQIQLKSGEVDQQRSEVERLQLQLRRAEEEIQVKLNEVERERAEIVELQAKLKEAQAEVELKYIEAEKEIQSKRTEAEQEIQLRIGELEREGVEVGKLRLQLREAEQEIQLKFQEVEQERAENEKLQRELGEVKQERDSLVFLDEQRKMAPSQEEYDNLKSEFTRIELELETSKNDTKKARNELEEFKISANNDLTRARDATASELDNLRYVESQLGDVTAKYEETKSMLKDKTVEAQQLQRQLSEAEKGFEDLQNQLHRAKESQKKLEIEAATREAMLTRHQADVKMERERVEKEREKYAELLRDSAGLRDLEKEAKRQLYRANERIEELESERAARNALDNGYEELALINDELTAETLRLKDALPETSFAPPGFLEKRKARESVIVPPRSLEDDLASPEGSDGESSDISEEVASPASRVPLSFENLDEEALSDIEEEHEAPSHLRRQKGEGPISQQTLDYHDSITQTEPESDIVPEAPPTPSYTAASTQTDPEPETPSEPALPALPDYIESSMQTEPEPEPPVITPAENASVSVQTEAEPEPSAIPTPEYATSSVQTNPLPVAAYAVASVQTDAERVTLPKHSNASIQTDQQAQQSRAPVASDSTSTQTDIKGDIPIDVLVRPVKVKEVVTEYAYFPASLYAFLITLAISMLYLAVRPLQGPDGLFSNVLSEGTKRTIQLAFLQIDNLLVSQGPLPG